MKRFPLAFLAVLTLTSGFLFAVDEPLGQLVQAVKVWIVNGEVSEEADAVVAVVKAGVVGTHQITGYKAKGAGKAEHWTVTITKLDSPNPQPPLPIPPGPPPTPQPTLQGFALEVYTQARGLPMTDCRRLAANYETTATMIAAGGIRDTQTANAKITELNKTLSLSPALWGTFAQWLGGKFNEQAQTLEATKKLMAETATGLNAAGAK
jgi:hypothetical protein